MSVTGESKDNPIVLESPISLGRVPVNENGSAIFLLKSVQIASQIAPNQDMVTAQMPSL